MRCPACGRETPDALMVCKHCGASTRPSILRRLFGWMRLPRVNVSVRIQPTVRRAVRVDEDPLGIEMPAGGVRSVSMTMTKLSRLDGADALETLTPEIREKLRQATSNGNVVRYQHVTQDDGFGRATVTEDGTPVDPELRAALQKLLEAESGTTEQQIVLDVDGTRQVYGSVDEMPPELRKMLGRFADAPINNDPTQR
jgi:hypothetical protein